MSDSQTGASQFLCAFCRLLLRQECVPDAAVRRVAMVNFRNCEAESVNFFSYAMSKPTFSALRKPRTPATKKVICRLQVNRLLTVARIQSGGRVGPPCSGCLNQEVEPRERLANGRPEVFMRFFRLFRRQECMPDAAVRRICIAIFRICKAESIIFFHSLLFQIPSVRGEYFSSFITRS